MLKTKLLIATAVAGIMFSNSAFAEQCAINYDNNGAVSCTCKDKNHKYDGEINVVGVGYVDKTPDVAYLSFTAFAENEEASVAESKVNDQVKLLTSFVLTVVKDDDAVTSGSVNVRPKYKYFLRKPNQEFAGFEVSRTVTVRVKDFNLIGEIISNALDKVGISKVNSITYDLLNRDVAQKEADSLAVADAIEKARRLAQVFSAELDSVPLSISYGTAGYDSTPRPMPVYEARTMSLNAVDGAENGYSQYVPEKLRITSNVYVSYAIRETKQKLIAK